MQLKNSGFYCRSTGHMKRDRGKNLVKWTNCGKTGYYSRTSKEWQSIRGGGDRNKGDGRVAELEKSMADLTEKICKVLFL